LAEPNLDRDQLVSLIVQQAALAAEGSYADRNPALGKMVRCPHCRIRRRQFETCCHPEYIVTNLADVPRSFYAKKRRNPRLTTVRPPLAEIHQILLDMEAQPGYTEREGISGIVEAQIVRRKKAAAKVKRDRQKLSRKINRDR
jgi:hypothetical protein